MPRSAGVYTLVSGNPVISGTTISSTWANNTLNDIASGITNSISSNGETSIIADLPMTTHRHTDVGNAVSRTDYASAQQVQDGVLVALTSISGTDTIVATCPLTLAAYAAGQLFGFIPAATNTGAVTININGIGSANIKRNSSDALRAGDLLINAPSLIRYNGTNFQLINDRQISVGNGLSFSSDLLSATSEYSAFIQDLKNSGVSGGTFNSGAWRTRDLNTLDDSHGIVGLSSNQITLQTGSYRMRGAATGHNCNSHKSRFRNITDGATVVQGQNSRSVNVGGPNGCGTSSMLDGRFTIASAKVFELQSWCETTQATDGFGQALSTGGTSEVYSYVIITKEY